MIGVATRDARAETGSMPVAMLLSLFAVALSAALMPAVLRQVSGTRQTVTRGHALHAAQTGLEVGLAAVRGAYTAGVGDWSKLPCTARTGSIGTEAVATYQVSFTYYPDDPTLSTPGPCPPGAARPHYVRLTSTGTTTGGRQIQRALRGDYSLRVAPPPPPPPAPSASPTPTPTPTWGPQNDGLRVQPREILAWSNSGSTKKYVCIDAGASQPAAGTTVKLQECDGDSHQDNSYKQFWYYRENLSIATVGSILANNPKCLDAGSSPAAGTVIKTQPCVTPVPVRQRWYYNAYANIELASSTGPGQDDVGLSGLCLNVANPETPGSNLILGGGSNCRSSSFNTRQTFSTYAKTGPGQAGSRPLDCTAAAGYPCVLTQIVNYGLPSRCVQQYTTFMANLECVQDPNPANIRRNQLWRLPKAVDGPTGATGPIVTVDASNRTYCLAATTSYEPVQQLCDPRNPTADQRFTVYKNTGGQFTMYRIMDSRSRCLTHPNQDDAGVGDPVFYWTKAAPHWKLRVESCVNDSSDPRAQDQFNATSIVLRQKWNAPFVLPTQAPSSSPSGSPSQTQSPTASPTASPTSAPSPVAAGHLENVVEIPCPAPPATCPPT
jgi:hypothetical protein